MAEIIATPAPTTAPASGLKLSFEDYYAIKEIIFEWADSYDKKDWSRLAKILAPKMMIDYTIVGYGRQDGLTAAEFLSLASSPAFLGDPLVKTQHLMGAGRIDLISETEAVSDTQIRAAHLRFQPDGVTVENHGHGHATINHWFEKHDGVWKLSGLRPKLAFNEGPFEKIFVQLKY